MEVEFRLDPERGEPKLVILAAADSPDLRRLAEELSGLKLDPVPVWDGETALLLPQGDFLRFYTDGKGVSAQTGEGTYALRLRLYELEERLDPRRFVRVSNSEIVNLDRVTGLDLTLAGTIKMTLEGGTVCWVSRRYVKKIKQALGL